MEKVKKHLFAVLWVTLYLTVQSVVMLVLFFAEIFKDIDVLLEISELPIDEMTIKLMELLSGSIIPTLLITAIIVILVFIIHLKITNKNNVIKPLNLENTFKYISIAIITNIVISLIVSFMPTTAFTEALNQSTSMALSGSFLPVFITTGILVPIMEEITFRYGIGYTLHKINSKYALILSAVIFGIMHGNLIQAIYAFLLGMMFGYFNEKENNLLPSILMHIAINSSSVIASFININEFITLPIIAIISLIFYGLIKLLNKR